MDAITVQDPALIERFNEIVEAKYAEAQQFPHAINRRRSGELGYVGFVVSGLDESVLVRRWDHTGTRDLRFADETLPPYSVKQNRDGTLTVTFGGDETQQPALASQLDLAAGMTVFLDELVPFGWVKDDRIVAIFYCDDVHRTELNGMVVNDRSVDCWVLEGEKLPDEIRMVKDDASWIERIKGLVLDGKLVRLSERIKNLPHEVWAKSDGVSQHYVEFDATDGQLPEFVPGVPYHCWHPLEAYPGEKFGASQVNNGEAYANPLKSWFR